MKILVYGAGVLGSLYAAKLHASGQDVHILARGMRIHNIREHGILLINNKNNNLTTHMVPIIETLTPEDDYDLVIVLVRKNQLPGVLPELAENKKIKNILFMVNSASGHDELIKAVGKDRVIIGFPGAGGSRGKIIVRYHIVSPLVQPTTLGELNGQVTPRLLDITSVLKNAGFPVALCKNMQAWQLTHVAMVSPIANAIYLAAGDPVRLANTRDGVTLMIRAIRENLKVLKASGVPITPLKYRFIEWLPEPLLVSVMQLVLPTGWSKTVIAEHANCARDEMQVLANEFQQIARNTDLKTPAADLLCEYIDPNKVPLPEKSKRIPLRWQGMVILLSGMAAGVLGLYRLGRK